MSLKKDLLQEIKKLGWHCETWSEGELLTPLTANMERVTKDMEAVDSVEFIFYDLANSKRMGWLYWLNGYEYDKQRENISDYSISLDEYINFNKLYEGV